MPTAAKAYAKSGTDMTVILPSRVRYSRPFNFPNWTQMRLGMFFSNVAAADDNGAKPGAGDHGAPSGWGRLKKVLIRMPFRSAAARVSTMRAEAPPRP